MRKNIYKYSYTENLSWDGTKIGDYWNNWWNGNIRGTDRENASSDAHVVTIPGSDNLTVTVTYWWESNTWDWVSVWTWNHINYTASSNYSSAISFSWMQKLWWWNYTSASNTNTVIVSWDTVTFSFKSDGSEVVIDIDIMQ